MKFQQICSALSVVEFAGVRFLIDPMLAPKNTYPTFPYTCVTGEGNPTTELPVPLESLFDVDAVIVTHLHLDHFDDTAREKLPKSLVLFAQSEEEASQLRGWGFADVRVLLEEGVEFEGVRLYKTRCEHGEGNPVTSDAYDFMGFSGKACGVVFEATESARMAESFRFYLAGDTSMTILAAVSAGALVPFFLHNVYGKTSKMFIGDGGTLVLGTVISIFVIRILQNGMPCEHYVGRNMGLIPFTLAQRLSNQTTISSFYVSAVSSSQVEAAQAAVSMAWLDWAPPVVNTVSQPSAWAWASRNSSLRTLLPPRATPIISSRLM